MYGATTDPHPSNKVCIINMYGALAGDVTSIHDPYMALLNSDWNTPINPSNT